MESFALLINHVPPSTSIIVNVRILDASQCSNFALPVSLVYLFVVRVLWLGVVALEMAIVFTFCYWCVLC